MIPFQKTSLIWLLLLLALVWSASPVYAQDPTRQVTDDEVNRVARELYCPICENTPLDVCETQACQDWRDEIRVKLATGQGEQQIIDYFADIYGPRARATPTTKGFSKWVWIVPIAGTIVFVAFFVHVLLRWRSRAAGVTEAPIESPLPEPNESDDYITRLEQEIRESA